MMRFCLEARDSLRLRFFLEDLVMAEEVAIRVRRAEWRVVRLAFLVGWMGGRAGCDLEGVGRVDVLAEAFAALARREARTWSVH